MVGGEGRPLPRHRPEDLLLTEAQGRGTLQAGTRLGLLAEHALRELVPKPRARGQDSLADPGAKMFPRCVGSSGLGCRPVPLACRGSRVCSRFGVGRATAAAGTLAGRSGFSDVGHQGPVEERTKKTPFPQQNRRPF